MPARGEDADDLLLQRATGLADLGEVRAVHDHAAHLLLDALAGDVRDEAGRDGDADQVGGPLDVGQRG